MDAFIFGLIISLLVSVWVYFDAKHLKIDGALTYAGATFLVLIVGLPLYVWERSKHAIKISGLICPNCHYEIKDEWISCPKCGLALKKT